MTYRDARDGHGRRQPVGRISHLSPEDQQRLAVLEVKGNQIGAQITGAELAELTMLYAQRDGWADGQDA